MDLFRQPLHYQELHHRALNSMLELQPEEDRTKMVEVNTTWEGLSGRSGK